MWGAAHEDMLRMHSRPYSTRPRLICSPDCPFTPTSASYENQWMLHSCITLAPTVQVEGDTLISRVNLHPPFPA